MTDTVWTSLINAGGYSQLNTGTALASSVTLTDISPGSNAAGQALLIPASYLYPGMQLRVRARGIFSTSGQPNLTLGLYYGGVAGIALASSTFAASAGASNAVWNLDADIRVESVGTAASLRTLGTITGMASTAGSGSPVMLPITAGGGGTASVASGSSQILTLGAQWGTNSASNTIQCLEFLVEQLN